MAETKALIERLGSLFARLFHGSESKIEEEAPDLSVRKKNCLVYKARAWFKIGPQVHFARSPLLIKPPAIFVPLNCSAFEFGEAVFEALDRSGNIPKSEWHNLLRDEEGYLPPANRNMFEPYARKTARSFDEKSVEAMDRTSKCMVTLLSNAINKEELEITPQNTYDKQNASYKICILDPSNTIFSNYWPLPNIQIDSGLSSRPSGSCYARISFWKWRLAFENGITEKPKLAKRFLKS